MQRIREFTKTITRIIFSKLANLKLIPPPATRENGISLIIRMKDEMNWIEYCILSFKNFADEILIADHGSTDGSVEFIQEFIKKHPEIPIKLFDRRYDTYLELSNFLLKETRYRWVMRADADFIAKTSGKFNILKLRRRILQLDPHIYYAIRICLVTLFLDFFHTQKNHHRHREIYLYTYSPDVVCYREGTYTDLFWFPLYYKEIEIPEPFIFHLFMRPRLRLLERKYWGHWRLEGCIMPLAEFVKKRIKTDFSTDSLAEAATLNLKTFFNEAEPYEPLVDDGYPELLKPYLENPIYKLIYDANGKIIDRKEPE